MKNKEIRGKKQQANCEKQILWHILKQNELMIVFGWWREGARGAGEQLTPFLVLEEF